jgi:uncharacterized integral membrane protein
VVAIALPTVALANGNVALGLGLLATFAGALLVMVLTDRRIARRRRADRARRAAARAAIDADRP